MNIEKQYIEHTIKTMQERLEHLIGLTADYKNKLEELEEGSYGEGLHKGLIMAQEQEIIRLESDIQFLQGSLKK